jgi:hypothetical protein
MTVPLSVPGPREVFALMQRRWLSNEQGLDASLLDDQAVIELPFAPPPRLSGSCASAMGGSRTGASTRTCRPSPKPWADRRPTARRASQAALDSAR